MPNGGNTSNHNNSAADAAGDLVFMMGKFEARIPCDRDYAQNHMWCRSLGDRLRFGFTSYAVRLLQDVYFLEWGIDPGTEVRLRQEIGSIESSKAESALYAPLAGTIVEFNQVLLSDPSAINVDNYGAGWLFDMTGDASTMCAPKGYVEYLGQVWEVAQRTIKGQLH
jgi:glycine cleavage system H protein